MAEQKEKKRVNSRSKGRGFEQQIARDLRAWLGDGWTVTRAQTDRQGGQVASVAGEFQIDGPWEFPFAIECKAHEAFEYSQLWTSPIVGPLPKFWSQAVRQAELSIMQMGQVRQQAGRVAMLRVGQQAVQQRADALGQRDRFLRLEVGEDHGGAAAGVAVAGLRRFQTHRPLTLFCAPFL